MDTAFSFKMHCYQLIRRTLNKDPKTQIYHTGICVQETLTRNLQSLTSCLQISISLAKTKGKENKRNDRYRYSLSSGVLLSTVNDTVQVCVLVIKAMRSIVSTSMKEKNKTKNGKNKFSKPGITGQYMLQTEKRTLGTYLV